MKTCSLALSTDLTGDWMQLLRVKLELVQADWAPGELCDITTSALW